MAFESKCSENLETLRHKAVVLPREVLVKCDDLFQSIEQFSGITTERVFEMKPGKDYTSSEQANCCMHGSMR